MQFQFQSGAVKSLKSSALSKPLTCFNSKVVRLKGYHQTLLMFGEIGFNSKVVRLKDVEMKIIKPTVQFQFQSGAVKSVFSASAFAASSLFQFQSGAVKSRV